MRASNLSRADPGMIASSLTADKISGAVQGPDDLASVHVGSIGNSASDDWLSDAGIPFDSYPNVESGLAALDAGQIDAFVYDEPLLRYRLRTGKFKDLRMLPGTFGRQDYGIAVASGSKLREPIDISLLRQVESQQWRAEVRQVLGKL